MLSIDYLELSFNYYLSWRKVRKQDMLLNSIPLLKLNPRTQYLATELSFTKTIPALFHHYCKDNGGQIPNVFADHIFLTDHIAMADTRLSIDKLISSLGRRCLKSTCFNGVV